MQNRFGGEESDDRNEGTTKGNKAGNTEEQDEWVAGAAMLKTF